MKVSWISSPLCSASRKFCSLNSTCLASNALALHAIWRFEPGDVLLHTLPIFHVHGLFVALHTAMLNASTVLFLETFDVDAVLSLLPEATVVMGVPTHYTRLLADPRFDADSCSSIGSRTTSPAPRKTCSRAGARPARSSS